MIIFSGQKDQHGTRSEKQLDVQKDSENALTSTLPSGPALLTDSAYLILVAVTTNACSLCLFRSIASPLQNVI
jgi:hypothetical protein